MNYLNKFVLVSVVRFLTRGCSLWNANSMPPFLQQLELAQRNVRPKLHNELQSYAHRRSRRNWRTLQVCTVLFLH
jgi:hypothetical protein